MVEFLLILGAVVIYFAPALVAAWVRHPKLAYISGVNAALGVTVVGWAGALMWALRRRKVVAMSYHGDMQVPRSFNTNLMAVSAFVIGVAIVSTVVVNRLQYRTGPQTGAPVYAAGAVSAPQIQWSRATVDGTRTASLASNNSLTLPAPYKGGPVVLSIAGDAAAPVVKLDADAELACSFAPAASSLEVSFDGGPGQAFACAPAPDGVHKPLFDGSHSTAYLADPAAFVTRLKGVRHVTITAAFSGVTEPQALEYDLPAEAPVVAVAPVAKAATAAAAPAAAAAVASALPKTADGTRVQADDQAGDDDHGHHRHHRHHRHSRAENGATYVDGVHAHHRGHSRHGVRHHHAGA
jgi:hypothetical protein